MNSVKTHQPKSLAEITAKYLYDNLPKDCIALITAQHEKKMESKTVYLYSGGVVDSLESIYKLETDAEDTYSAIKVILDDIVQDKIYILEEERDEITFISVRREIFEDELKRRDIRYDDIERYAYYLDESGFYIPK